MKLLKNKKQLGGVIFNSTNSNPFDFIMNMLKENKCKIELISFSSLYSFVLNIKLNDNTISPFKGLNNTGTSFTIPINSLILKILILKNGSIDPLYEFMPEKKTTTNEQFINEVKNQQDVYKKTLIKGRPLCPSIVSALKLNKYSSIEFINNILSKNNEDNIKSDFTTLLSILENESNLYNLGIIIMENAENFIPVAKFLGKVKKNNINRPDKIYDTIYDKTLINTVFTGIRMLYEGKIINTDLNNGNILCRLGNNNNVEVKLIDFGEILKKNNNSNLNLRSLNELTIEKLIIKLVKFKNSYGPTIFMGWAYDKLIEKNLFGQLLELIKKYNLLPSKEYLSESIKNINIIEI